MSEVFLKVVNMGISASWLVLTVLLLRLVLKKAPKWICVILWGFVAIRLICPFSIESVLSLIPSAETVSPEIMMDWTPEVSTGIDSLDTVINPIISQSFAPQAYASANPLQILIPVCANLWILGILIMLLYTAFSYFLLRRKIAVAVRLRDNIYQSENVVSPFVLGIIKPRIYLPFRMGNNNSEHVIAHEQSHICRKDHWWKPLGFLLLTIHWFNPLMWLGYVFLCRDIELACDEKVIFAMDNNTKADYTEALVACSVHRRSIAACPLAFGEVGVKTRVKSILNYKKPTLWVIIAAILVCVAVAFCFLTDPQTQNSPDSGQAETIVGNLRTYYKNADGTWECDGYTYKHRLEIKPTESYHDPFTFVYLSNLENITFSQAYLASGVSSSLTDYFSPEEAVLVEWLSLDENREPIKENTKTDYGAAVRPEQITGVVKATLELPRSWDTPRTVTNPKVLRKIESILQRSEVLESGAKCLFTGKLTLTLASGEILSLAMSEDHCATWLSEGIYYTYSTFVMNQESTQNDELYDLFTTYP